MADVLTADQRHKCMSAVRRENTGPEKLLRSLLHKSGLRYRLHHKKLPGTPDLVFTRFRAVIFVHGCYWHTHGCYKSTVPKTNRDFWEKKLAANKERDSCSIRSLQDMGWRVMIVWECALKGKVSYSFDLIVSKVNAWLQSSKPFSEIPDVVTSTTKIGSRF